jgi:membrane protease subunit HflC
MRGQLPRVITGVLLVAILALYMVTYQVRATQVAVIKTFGRADPDDVVTAAGFGWKWPWPIQQIVTYDNRTRVFADTFEETATRDQKNLVLTAYIGWRISDPLQFLRTVKTQKAAEERLRGLVRNYKTAVVGQYDFANFVSTNPQDLKFSEIEADILGQVQAVADQQFGIDVVTLGIKRLALPQNITVKVFDRMRKTREKLAKDYVAQGKAEAARITAEAESAKEQIVAFAERQAAAIRAEGERRISESLARFKEDEWFANYLRSLDFLRATLDKNTTIFLDGPPFDMFRQGPQNVTLEAPAVSEMPRPAEAMQ